MRTLLNLSILLSLELPASPLTRGQKAGEQWENPLGFVFCWCPPSDSAQEGFWLGKYEVTLAEFDLITRKRPRGAIAKAAEHPRDSIRYDDVLLFISELNRRERFTKRLPDDWEYCLPSPEDWEYACRAGTKTPFPFGDDVSLLPRHANFADKSLFETRDNYFHYARRDLDDGTAFLAIGQKYPANRWGLHNMLGNLWEWTSKHNDSMATVCGGSWISLPDYCTPAFRHAFSIESEKTFIGFRLALKRSPK